MNIFKLMDKCVFVCREREREREREESLNIISTFISYL
jgi:hypothetical protein